ncbi:aminomethyltransferase [Malassezia furfur]|uniref:Aminomethyltransferase n=1 Tax=Malassezia furfur TaxID=55194 RepID=A0ABY8EN38_MALFU|nr:GCV1 [Malassezia furfur]WFD46973.1 aminomethyltransferase [Malassezia furfur]
MLALFRRVPPARAAAARALFAGAPRAFHAAAVCRALGRTGLYEFHEQHGAKMVPFGGYQMPLTYGKVGQVASHKHVREHAGLFDVGHMVQHKFKGATAAAFLQHITPASLGPDKMKPFTSTLSVLLSPEGGILDDLIITKHGEDEFYVVTNAGCRDEDLAYIAKHLDAFNKENVSNGYTEHEVMDKQGLLALQGPSSAAVLAKLLPADFDLSKLTFGQSAFVDLQLPNHDPVHVHVARGGYTGEDGFEISIPPADTVAVAEALLADAEVELAGLAARDSLRLEAGMCLYGHDLDPSVSPVEGALAWTVGKDRREAGDFLGAERVLRELKEGPPRRRVGLIVEGPPAREGAKVYAEDGTTEIGRVTSGIPSPTLGQNIAMALVKNGHHTRGSTVLVEVRNKKHDAIVTRMPFVPNKFYRG